MQGSDKITNAFLDIDRADVVFELFFVFVRDDGSAVQEEETFESAMGDILPGVRVPDEALARLRAIYDRTLTSEPTLYDSATRLNEQLAAERPLLVMVFSVLLRLAMDEGMMCRRDRERLGEVLQLFKFTPQEIELVPEPLQENLDCFIWASGYHEELSSPSTLSQHFEVLQCTPESSTEELRSSYRRLVKRYHPDKHSDSNGVAHRKQFERVQAAYEAITQAKRIS